MIRRLWKDAYREESGFTLIELLVVIVILGILATIVVVNVGNAATKAKQSSLKTTLATLQTASDNYYFDNSAYAIMGSTQPTAGTAEQLDATNPPGTGDLYNTYLHTVPDTNAADYGLSTATSSTLYYGVTATGKVFATTTLPSSWAISTIVYTQNHVIKGVALNTIW